MLLAHDLNEILQVLLIKITDKERSVDIDEQTKSQFMQLLWHTCIPLHSVQSKLMMADSAEQNTALE